MPWGDSAAPFTAAEQTPCKCPAFLALAFAESVKMLLGSRTTLGAFVPDDYVAMYCWANDIVAARLDRAFRPANLRDVIASCETGNDASRVMFAIRQRTIRRSSAISTFTISVRFTAQRISASGSATKSTVAKVLAKKRWRWRSTIAGNTSISSAWALCVPAQCAGDRGICGLRFQERRHPQAYSVRRWCLGRSGVDGAVPPRAQARAQRRRHASKRDRPDPRGHRSRCLTGFRVNGASNAATDRGEEHLLCPLASCLFTLLEQRLERSGIAPSLRRVRVELVQPTQDLFVVGAELLCQRVRLGAEGVGRLGVFFLLRLLHLFLELADVAIGLHLGFVAADRLDALLYVGHCRLRRISGRAVLLGMRSRRDSGG